MIATADWTADRVGPDGIRNPHVWLGLSAEEQDAAAIVLAARRRLETLRDAYGSETDVTETLVAIVVTARQAMLGLARQAATT